MLSAIYQLALVISMAVLAMLLVRGYTLIEALYRSGVVLIVVLFILTISGKLFYWSIQAQQLSSGNDEKPSESVSKNETNDSDSNA